MSDEKNADLLPDCLPENQRRLTGHKWCPGCACECHGTPTPATHGDAGTETAGIADCICGGSWMPKLGTCTGTPATGRGQRMNFMLGNISPEGFAAHVDSPFTDAELVTLHQNWSQLAVLIGPEDFHIFEAPSGRPTVTVGSVTAKVLDVFKAANARKQFPFEVAFSLDERWKKEER